MKSPTPRAEQPLFRNTAGCTMSASPVGGRQADLYRKRRKTLRTSTTGEECRAAWRGAAAHQAHARRSDDNDGTRNRDLITITKRNSVSASGSKHAVAVAQNGQAQRNPDGAPMPRCGAICGRWYRRWRGTMAHLGWFKASNGTVLPRSGARVHVDGRQLQTCSNG